MDSQVLNAGINHLPEIYSFELMAIKETEPEHIALWMKSIPNHLN
jgi:hypothetical protein